VDKVLNGTFIGTSEGSKGVVSTMSGN